MNYRVIGCIAGNSKKAKSALDMLKKNYNFIDIREHPEASVDAIIVLGGDGFMLHSLHQYMDKNVPFYGMNCGTIGFLMNNFIKFDVVDKINQAKLTSIHPLKMQVCDRAFNKTEALAINEVALFRQTNQISKIKVIINGETRIRELVGDGIMVATGAGSSAYNFSAGGPIIPIGSRLLALTPISAFRPRRWRGALIPHNSKVRFEIMEESRRPVSAVADFYEIRDVITVEVEEDYTRTIKLLFEPGHSLEDRIMREQFEI